MAPVRFPCALLLANGVRTLPTSGNPHGGGRESALLDVGGEECCIGASPLLDRGEVLATTADVSPSCLSASKGDANKRPSAPAMGLPSSEAPLAVRPSCGGWRCAAKRLYCSVVMAALGLWNGTFTASCIRDA